MLALVSFGTEESGQTTASGPEQLHMDRLGRIRIQFDFQRIQPCEQLSNNTTWVRVLQR
jgi:type VI secretion system secreted protein VgrG